MFLMNFALKECASRRAEFCKLFGNTSRILILWSLSERELPVTKIADEVGTSLPNTSQHLALLKEHNIVSARRDGQTIYYRISDIEWLNKCPAMFRALKHDLPEK